MAKAKVRLRHGTPTKDGSVDVKTFNVGDDVSGVPDSVLKAWRDAGYLEKSEPAPKKGEAGTKASQ